MDDKTKAFLDGWLASEDAYIDSISVKRVYIDICDGNLYDGLMLSQIIYWHGKNKETGKPRLKIEKNGHLWLAKSYEDWWNECRVTERTARSCITRLEELGVIKAEIWKFAGSPTKHIRMEWDRFVELLMEIQKNPPTKPRSKSVLTSKVITPETSDRNDLKGQIEMTGDVESICPQTSDPIQRLPSETTSKITSEITFSCLGTENENDPKTEVPHGSVDSPHPSGSDSSASQGKSQKSQSKAPKKGKNKNQVSEEETVEYQPLLDVYNQEKPEAWDKAHSLTNSRLTGLKRYEVKYGRDRMVEMMRRALLGAKRTKMASFPWSIDVLLKDDKDWFVVFVEKTQDGEIDSPRAAIANNLGNEKVLRLMEKHTRALGMITKGEVA